MDDQYDQRPRADIKIVTYDGYEDTDFGLLELSEFGGYRFKAAKRTVEFDENVTYYVSLVHEAMSWVESEYERYCNEKQEED